MHMTTLAAIQPLYVLTQIAFLLAGSLLLWFGGRVLAKLPKATFGRSLFAYLLIVIVTFVLAYYGALLACRVSPYTATVALLADLIYIAIVLLASWSIIKFFFKAPWLKVVLAWLPTLIAVFAALPFKAGLVRPWLLKPTKIIVSYETTRLLGPLNPDGTVNYLAALNEKYSQGITTDNNAAVLLLQAFGPDWLPEETRDRVLNFFPSFSFPNQGNYFVTFHDHNSAALYDEAFYDTYEKVHEHPWSPEQYPEWAEWLRANEEPLALVIAATTRPRYYIPFLSPDDPPSMITGHLPGLQNFRMVSYTLICRAMLKADSGDFDAACADLLAVHRLARLISQGPTLIESLVGVAIEAAACEADNTLSVSGKLSVAQAREYLWRLQALPPFPSLAELLDNAERLHMLDSVMICYHHGPEYLWCLYNPQAHNPSGSQVYPPEPPEYQQVRNPRIDWNEVLRRINAWCDRLVDAADRPTFAQRQQASAVMSAEQEAIVNRLTGYQRSGPGILERLGFDISDEDMRLTPPKNTNELTDMLISQCGSMDRVSLECDRATMMLRTTQTSLALAAYKAENGHFPQNLSELCPTYFKTVPENLFTAQPLDYQPIADGYILSCPVPGVYGPDYDITIQVPVPVEEEPPQPTPARMPRPRRSRRR